MYASGVPLASRGLRASVLLFGVAGAALAASQLLFGVAGAALAALQRA